MKLSGFDFGLPKELIAQEPAGRRERSKLLVLNRETGGIKHDIFKNIGSYLRRGDLLVFNDTKVLPVRLFGRKESGGKVEVLLLPPNLKNFIGKNLGKARKIFFDQGLIGSIDGNQIIFNLDNTGLLNYLNKYGQVPYPPYIRKRGLDDRYQTVYAKVPGSAAAPTAGFHFSRKLLEQLGRDGIGQAFITLHIGLGTFQPVKTENIEEHKIHSEFFQISSETVGSVQKAVGRIIGVGTTTVRTLETWAMTGKTSGETDIYIYPGFEFKVVDGLITNFHMPGSSLVLLVAAFVGRENLLRAYSEAIRRGYRWGSFGDAMLIV